MALLIGGEGEVMVQVALQVIDLNGARSRNRTGTMLPSRDFKSLASTSFAIRAGWHLEFE